MIGVETQEFIGSNKRAHETLVCLELTMSGSCLDLPDLRHVKTARVDVAVGLYNPSFAISSRDRPADHVTVFGLLQTDALLMPATVGI